MSRVNKAHHHAHERTIDEVTFKGVAGRRDEMNVWGLRGRIHTEAVYHEDLSGSPPFFLDFKKDGALIDPAIGGLPVPTLPDEVVIATHCSVTDIAEAPLGFEAFQFFLFDSTDTLISAGSVIEWGNGVVQTVCFVWDAPFAFSSCDNWYVIGVSTFSAEINTQIRIVMEFVAIEA